MNYLVATRPQVGPISWRWLIGAGIMHLTSTFADGLLAIALGILGSVIAAFVYGRLPAIGRALSAWIASRSRRSKEARLRRLRRDLERIDTFKRNPTEHFRWSLRELNRVHIAYLWTTLFFVSGLTFEATSTNLEGARSSALFFLGLVTHGFAFGFMIVAVRRNEKLDEFLALEDTEKELRDEITSLAASVEANPNSEN